MKRFVLYVITLSLVVSMAAPAGAVFASDTPPPETEPIEAAAEGTDAASATKEEAPVEQAEATPEAQGPVVTRKQPPKNPATQAGIITIKGDEDGEPSKVEVVVPEQPAEPLAPQRKVFVTAFQTEQSLGFVELYNNDTKTQSVDGWKMSVLFDDDSTCEVPLAGYVLPKERVLLVHKDSVGGVQNALKYDCGDLNRLAVKIELYDGEQLVERLIPTSASNFLWVRNNTTATYLTGEFAKDFKANGSYSPIDGYWYIPPDAPAIKILEVLVNPRQCLPSEDDLACYDFVKIQNTSDQPIDLANYRLRAGFSNSASSSSNTSYFSLILEPGEVRTLTRNRSGDRISITANDGTVWFEDTEGVMTYPTEVPPYIGSDLDSKRGLSWAYDQRFSQWRWAIPSPTSIENYFPEEAIKSTVTESTLKPCRANQYRSPETNRCRNNTQAQTLVPCREGQVRNPDTNRCRSVATLASSLTPCREDQFRNPETNRCKKIATATAGLADCGEGRERNPATNRCRNIANSTPPVADFAVEAVKEPASVFIGWAVLGGITLLALGYAGWEWRHEIGGILRRLPGIGRLIK